MKDTTEPFMFSEFADEIRNLSPTGPTEEELQAFLLGDSGKIRVCYAPFDWVNAQARLIVVGITPGKDSMLNGGSIKRGKPLGVDGSVVLPDALRAPRKPGSPYQIAGRYPGARPYIGLPE